MLENVPVQAELSAPPSQANVPLLHQPGHVQPLCTNRASKMAEAIAIIEEDDDGTTRVPGRRKQQAETEPEQFSTVPEGVECNPMAPSHGSWIKSSNMPLNYLRLYINAKVQKDRMQKGRVGAKRQGGKRQNECKKAGCLSAKRQGGCKKAG
jgi:hypothetical protein